MRARDGATGEAGAISAVQERRLQAIWGEGHGLWERLASVDHKAIGIRYLVTAFLFLLAGGAEALAIRWQLAGPEMGVLSPEAYNQLFTMHGITMILLYASPVLAGFGNYFVPLLIGTRDMAYPRLNAFSYWSYLFSGLFLYSSFLVGAAPDAGWFAYAPLTEAEFSPGPNLDFYALGLLFLTVSTTAGAINFISTILKLRAPGMSLNRMPLYLWSTLTASFSIVLSLPALTAALVFLEFDRALGMHFYDALAGGTPLLWEHLFWIFGHPWVYIVFLPATGIVNMALPVWSGRPMVGYAWVALSTVAIGFIGFGVWVHHMFATGIAPVSLGFFSGASMTIAIPSAITVFAWIATLWYGKPRLNTGMLFVLGFIFVFVLGGISGVMTGSVPFDLQAHDTYFVVAHLHYVLAGANVFPVFAGFYYWLPKITGRKLDERLGKWNFWLMFAGINVLFFPMHITGLLGMPRRVYTYQTGLGWGAMNLISTAGAAIMALGVLAFVANFFRSRRTGEPAGDDPWGANTLEWSVSSPPPDYDFPTIPVVRTRDPLWDREHWIPDPEEGALVLDEDEDVLRTSWLDARPERVIRMPGESRLPLWLGLSLTALFVGLLIRDVTWAALGGAAAGLVMFRWLWTREEEVDVRPEPEPPGRKAA